MAHVQYGSKDESSFPIWTCPRPGILEPLRLPSPPPSSRSILEDPEIICLFCEEMFLHPQNHTELLKHLLTDHKFVIADVNMIGNFPAYIRYWKNKFRTTLPTTCCTIMKAKLQVEGGVGEEQEFTFLSDVHSEDKELRKKLQMDRLEFVLKVQEKERKDTDFSRGCLFCRQDFTSSSALFDHMAFDHNFSVGNPDNLVFVKEFLDLIESKLEQLLCLHCEKVFKSREVLKEHMRKKMHKKLNPKNKEWDKFYLVNYLEFGKTWEDIAREDDSGVRGEEELPSGWDTEDRDGEDNDWSDWRGDHGGAVCLFCPVTYQDTKELVNHMNIVHGFDFLKLKTELKLNFYQQVKMINFIRRSVHLNTCIGCADMFDDKDKLVEHMTWSNHHQPGSAADWDQPQYYFPTYENDNLLFGLEDPDGDNKDSEDTGFCSDSSLGQPTVLPEDIPAPVRDSILQQEEVRRSLVPTRRTKSKTRKH
eukprot:TRINITY_DN52697_c0_g1_i1.p1 TRINITY_DN52697_c0_g1~~TRINITY_DN52697_c0_g1_i1.p1  ORF type:complete len:476 (+),score=156.19 TRINITY_DN52697_c0_g1_i1:54-1481(+)